MLILLMFAMFYRLWNNGLVTAWDRISVRICGNYCCTTGSKHVGTGLVTDYKRGVKLTAELPTWRLCEMLKWYLSVFPVVKTYP